MPSRKVTVALLISTVVLLAGWDLYVALNDTPNDTISYIVLAFAQRHPIVALCVGIVLGHVFWPNRTGT